MEEPSPKRHKVDGIEETQPPTSTDDFALATAVSRAMENSENAAAFHEASLASYSGYDSVGPSTGQEEITVRDVGGAGAPSLNELLQLVQTQVSSVASEGLIASATALPSSSPWLQKDSDLTYLGGLVEQGFGGDGHPSYDPAFDISDYIHGLTYEEPEDGASMRITATPDLVPGGSSQGGITPNSILESPAGPNGARPLDASPKGLRESAPSADRPITAYTYDFYKEVGIPEGPHFHRGVEWSWDGEMQPGEWPIPYEERAVSSTV
jgi:hypothetical protein